MLGDDNARTEAGGAFKPVTEDAVALVKVGAVVPD